MGIVIKLQSKTVKTAKKTKPKNQEAKAELKAFWVQYPKAQRVFGEIFKVWKISGARRRDSNGYWAAYTYAEWCSRLDMASSTLRWNLDLLEQRGLIERKRGRHGGTRVVTFMRPTNKALDLSGGDDRIWQHLNKKHYEPKLEPSNQLFKPVLIVKNPPLEPDPEDPPITSLDQLLTIINGS